MLEHLTTHPPSLLLMCTIHPSPSLSPPYVYHFPSHPSSLSPPFAPPSLPSPSSSLLVIWRTSCSKLERSLLRTTHLPLGVLMLNLSPSIGGRIWIVDTYRGAHAWRKRGRKWMIYIYISCQRTVYRCLCIYMLKTVSASSILWEFTSILARLSEGRVHL